MSSVISYKSSATNQTSYSVRSELRSAVSGYSRNGSAYSQKRKEIIDHERKSEMNDLVQKQLLEQERHKKLMLENKKRTKMQQEQLKKELEDKRIQEEELLRKMKEEKQTAYMRYLKDNSKEILQNFKKKDSNGNPDESKNLKKAPLAPINYAKNKPTSAEPLPPRASRSKLSGISNNQGGHYNKPASANSNLNLPRVREVPQEQQRQETTPDNNNNLNALDLEFNRSTNNFKKIIDQYHKEMHQLKSQQGPRTQPDEMSIPLQQFYDAQAQQYLPMPPSKLLESLDLSSSLTKWDPSKPLDPSLEPFWHAESGKKEPKETGKYGNYGGYGRQEHRKEAEPEWEKSDEEDKKEEDEVDEIIEPCEDDSIEYDKASNVSSNITGRNIQRKKLVKVSEVSQKELKQNWHLQYIDSQSQIKSKPPAPGMSITPKNLPSLPKENVVVTNKDPKSLGSIPNEQPKPQQQEPRKIISAKEARESLEKEMDFGNYGVFQQQTGLNFKWAAGEQDDDFYKELDRKVPSRTKNRDKNLKEEKKIENKKAVPQDSGNKVNAMFADEEWEGISNAPSQQDKKTSVVNNKPEVKKNTRVVKAEEVKKINPVPKVNSKPASVVSNTSQTKKAENEKENKSRNAGLVSKLQGQVKAAAQGIPKKEAKKPPVGRGGKRPDSPTTKCTRDTDLDVEEFLKDDFELLNKEEAHLQREILDMHAQKIGKVRAVEQKHNINTAYQNTQQYVTKNPVPQSAGGSQNEDDLEESLERLDIILAKQRNAGPTKTITNPQNQQNKPSQPQVYQKESSLYNQVMQQPIPKPQQIPQYHPAPMQDNIPPVNPYRDVQSNPPQGPQGGAGYGSGYTNYPQPMQNMPPYDPYYAAQHHQQQQLYANINMQGGPGGPQGYPMGQMGQQEPVYSPEFGYNKGLQVQNNQQYPYYQPPYQPQGQGQGQGMPPSDQQQYMQQKPQYPVNQPQNMMGYQPQGQRNAYEESFGNPVQGQGQGQNNEYQDQLQLIYGNGLKISQLNPEGENEDKMKAFSFGNNLNAPVKEGGYRDLAKGNNQVDNSDKHSVVSSKATEMTVDRSVNEERGAGGSYANKKQGGQQKETKGYGAAKKPAANKGKEGNPQEITKGEGDVKIVANADLKHLLFE